MATQLVQPLKATPTQILTRGLAVGFVATQVLDIVSMFFYENMTAADRLAEDRVRGGHQAYEKLVMKIAGAIEVKLSEDEIKYWGWKLHRAFGFTGGVQYMALREFFPGIGDGAGLLFGIGFFIAADEVMTALTGATPPPQAFPWKAHVRGALAHIAYGIAAELTARSFDRVGEYEDGVGWARAEDEGRARA